MQRKSWGKTVVVVSSDPADSEVDFPHHPPNQPLDVLAEQPQELNPHVNISVEEPQEPNQPLDVPAEGPGEPEEPNQSVNIPAEQAEELQEPNNPNPLPEQPPMPMANNQLN